MVKRMKPGIRVSSSYRNDPKTGKVTITRRGSRADLKAVDDMNKRAKAAHNKRLGSMRGPHDKGGHVKAPPRPATKVPIKHKPHRRKVPKTLKRAMKREMKKQDVYDKQMSHPVEIPKDIAVPGEITELTPPIAAPPKRPIKIPTRPTIELDPGFAIKAKPGKIRPHWDRQRIPCPEGRPGCKVLHFAPGPGLISDPGIRPPTRWPDRRPPGRGRWEWTPREVDVFDPTKKPDPQGGTGEWIWKEPPRRHWRPRRDRLWGAKTLDSRPGEIGRVVQLADTFGKETWRRDKKKWLDEMDRRGVVVPTNLDRRRNIHTRVRGGTIRKKVQKPRKR